MNYKDYVKARNLAWKILIDCNISELPVKITNICEFMDIKVASYRAAAKLIKAQGWQQFANQNDGFSTFVNGRPVIFFNEKCLPQRCRFTIAHELGHILLGHVKEGMITAHNKEPDERDDPMEQQANTFAARILAPAVILWALDLHNTKDVARVCDISIPAAKFRAVRMNELYKRDKFLSSPLETQVLKSFRTFIDRNARHSQTVL